MANPTLRALYNAASPGLVTLIPYHYHWDDLVAAFSEQNRGTLEQNIRPAGTYFIKLIREGEIPQGVVSEQVLNNFIQEWAMALDLAYFFGNLYPHITIAFDENEIMEGRLGFYDPTRHEIWLQKTMKQGGQWVPELAIELIASLLHEMMHAFFGVFLRGELLYVSARLGGNGEGGHGRPWANSMVICGDALKREVPFSMDIPLFDSIEMDMELSFWKPTLDEMSLWGASEAEIFKWQQKLQPWQEFTGGILAMLLLVGSISFLLWVLWCILVSFLFS